MARYVHNKSGTEYTTGMIIFTVIILLFIGWVLAGAIAAIPAFFGAIEAALWAWGIAGGAWTGFVFLGMFQHRSESRKLPR